MLTSKRKKARRKTPWDARRARRVAIPTEENRPEHAAKEDAARMVRINLHGLYVFDPDRATRDDFRRFLWAGLRVLRTEARARGLSEGQVQELLNRAFVCFHDSADSLWVTLKKIVAGKKTGSTPTELISIVTEGLEQRPEKPRPQPEFVWNEGLYRARKAALEFSKETHADY